MQPLEGIKVIELSSVLAGPAVGMFMAEMGATVIKIEPPEGDVTRTWKVANENPNTSLSAYYSSVNWGKEVITLSLKTPEALQKIHSLLQDADVLICNFKPGSDKKLGLDYLTLSKKYPQLIYANITGYGFNSDRAGYDAVAQAESGFMYLNRAPNTIPTKMPVAMIDLMAAHQLKEGILVALFRRERQKIGALVEVSLIESGVASLANQAATYLFAQQNPQPMGSEHPSIYPYGAIFSCQNNEFIMLAIGNDMQFNELCSILNVEWHKDKRFESNILRVQYRDELRPLLQSSLEAVNRDKFLFLLHQKHIPAGAINSVVDALHLPQVQNLLLHDTTSKQKGLKTAAFYIDRQMCTNLSSPKELPK